MLWKSEKYDNNYFSKINSYRKLNEKEIHELYKRKPKTKVVKEITLRNLQLAAYLARNWQQKGSRYGVDFMDLVGASTISLLKATRNYNPALGGYYKYVCSYIVSCLEAELFKHLNFSRVYGKQRLKNGLDINPTEPLQKILCDNAEGEPLLLQDILVSPEDAKEYQKLEVHNLLEELERAKKNVHPLAHTIIQLRLGVGNRRGHKPLALSAVAKMVNLSKEGVRKIELKALAYLRKL